MTKKALLLYSGGKDSSLVAYMLKTFNYKLKLVTANFGIVESAKTAETAAKALGFEHEIYKLDSNTIEKAADIAEKDGFPLNAINFVHKKVLEKVAENYGKEYPVITDGTRRDDKTPKLTFPEMQSLEDRYSIEYSAPLRGMSYKTIKYLTDELFKTKVIQAGSEPTSEYETEIRAVLRTRNQNLEKNIFPKNHTHTIVTGWKK